MTFRRIAILCVAACLWPGVARAQLTTVLSATFVTVQALDVHSTRVALRSGRAREANPLLRDLPMSGIVAVKAVSGAVVLAAVAQLRVRHPFAARIILLVVDVVSIIIVVHNYRLARQKGIP